MKTIMIIGAGRAQVPLIEAAKKEGYRTVVCDIYPGAPGVALADDYFQVSTKDREGLYRIAQKKRINGIVANSEYAMCDVAFITSRLGLVGNPENSIAVLSSKSAFRSLQKIAGLFAPRPYEDNEDATFPLIIKPDMNTGTRGTAVINDLAEMEASIRTCSELSRNGKAIVEEYIQINPQTVIEGEIFIHNEVILWDGLFQSIRSTKAPMIPMTYVFPLIEDRVDELRSALGKAFHAAGVIHGEYNIEACFVDDKPFIIEINPRQGGNELPRYVQEHCGIDYYRLLVTTSVGDDRYWKSLGGLERRHRRIIHHMLFPRATGRFMGTQIAKELEQYISHIELYVNNGEIVRKAVDGSSSIGYADFVFANQEEQNSVCFKLEDLIRIEVNEI